MEDVRISVFPSCVHGRGLLVLLLVPSPGLLAKMATPW
jgi:hypothetical protein